MGEFSLENSQHFAMLPLVSPQIDIWETNTEHHYPDLGSASGWLKQISHMHYYIRSTTQIWVVTHHQYGNSAFVSQTSFSEKTIGVTKCWLFFQATICSTHVVVVHFYSHWYMYTVDWHQSCHVIIYFTCSSILWHWEVYALWANDKLKFALQWTYVLQWAKSTKRASVINGCRRASSGVILLSGSITRVLFNKSVNWYLQKTHKFSTG